MMSDDGFSGAEDVDDIVREHEDKDKSADKHNSDGENSDNEVDNERIHSDEEAKEVTSVKKRVDPIKRGTRKLVVLNTERLKGPKGVHTIEKLFQGFKFKGKGHEKEDLNRVMKRLEYWSFRMYPKLEFDDILAKVEHLGAKKDLQVHLTKYRTDMISADDDMSREVVSDDDEIQQNVIEPTESTSYRNESDILFDELLRNDQLPVPGDNNENDL